MAKKSFYVFLSAILGVLLFLVLHRIIIFIYLLLSYEDYQTFGMNLTYLQYLALDYITLTLAMFGGLWYGIWLGLYWYEKVYEEGSHKGFVHHLAANLWGRKTYSDTKLEHKLNAAKEKMEKGLWEMEGLVKGAELKVNKTIKKTIVRKSVSRKSKTV